MSNRVGTTALVLLALALVGPTAVSAQANAAAGVWSGAIELPTGVLEVSVTLSAGANGPSGTIDIPAQGVAGLALENIQIEGALAQFTISTVPGAPTFNGTRTGDVIAGTFTQGGAALPFRLERGELAAPGRPQEPQPPFPYRVEEVEYPAGDVTLAATLTVPEGAGPFPGVVLITGSGAQNRDEELAGHKPFHVLADHLTRAGIAVLRADDRGVGGSSGSNDGSTTQDFADDALAGLRLLAARPEVAADRVGFVGHSEGGLVAPLATTRGDGVAFVVMLAGPAVSLGEVLAHQTEAIARAGGAPDAVAAEIRAAVEEIVIAVRTESDPEALVAALQAPIRRQFEASGVTPTDAEVNAQATQAMAQFGTPWFRWVLDHDPIPALTSMDMPVLALNGSLDMQVLVDQNIPPLEQAFRDGGNPDVTVRVLPGLNHLFQHTETGNPAEYGVIEETMSPEVLDLVADWILERFGGNH